MNIVHEPETFVKRVTQELSKDLINGTSQPFLETVMDNASVVLLLLGMHSYSGNDVKQLSLILNKRSRAVVQPGDLCCPGGGIAPGLDRMIAAMLKRNPSSLTQWKFWKILKARNKRYADTLCVLLATALREGVEEMRLNPFGVKFLGALPPQSLVMFKKTIHPMVCWVSSQQRFFPNWEVEKIIHIPIQNLLDSSNYGTYRLSINTQEARRADISLKDLPCYLHQGNNGREILWGATFRIVMDFLNRIFGFKPPENKKLPVYYGSIGNRYMKNHLKQI